MNQIDSSNLEFEDWIRLRAYELWETAGRPESDGVNFWVQAEQDYWIMFALGMTAKKCDYYYEMDEYYRIFGDPRRGVYMALAQEVNSLDYLKI